MTNVQQQPKVSVGGKIVMGFGAFLILGGLFMVGSPFIAIFVIIMGIIALIRGHGMKVTTTTAIQPTGTQTTNEKTYTNLGQKKDTKGALSNVHRKGKGAI